jgi:DNA-binding response OmpR family regulator
MPTLTVVPPDGDVAEEDGRPGASGTRDLAVLAWPEDAAEAERLRKEGVPRLLLVPHEQEAPQDVDHLAEWVRVPAEEREVAARVVALLRRAEAFSVRPHVDEHGRIAFRDRWSALSPTEARIAAVLCDRYCDVVSTDELRTLASPDDGRGRGPSPAAFRVHLHRLRQRIAGVGLEVVSVRNEGVILQPRPENARHAPPHTPFPA